MGHGNRIVGISTQNSVLLFFGPSSPPNVKKPLKSVEKFPDMLADMIPEILDPSLFGETLNICINLTLR